MLKGVHNIIECNKEIWISNNSKADLLYYAAAASTAKIVIWVYLEDFQIRSVKINVFIYKSDFSVFFDDWLNFCAFS
jgi:hypothetical protein